MEKYPLTPEGVQAKQEELYKLDDRELINQAISISKDSRSWVFENFKLSDEQIEYYNSLPEDFNYYLGWQIAAGVIGREPIKIDPVPAGGTNRKKKTSVSLSGSVETNPSTGQTTWGGTVSIGFTF